MRQVELVYHTEAMHLFFFANLNFTAAKTFWGRGARSCETVALSFGERLVMHEKRLALNELILKTIGNRKGDCA